MNKEYIYYVNGKWLSGHKAMIPFHDAGFLYGDGLFETVRFDDGIIFNYDKHYQRLNIGLDIIDLSNPYNKSQLFNILNELIKKNKINSGIIRLMITRGTLDSLLSNPKPNIYINIKPFYEIPKDPVKVIFYSEKKFPIIRKNPAIKSMNYLGNMLAKKECNKDGAFEPVFYNDNNMVTECAIRNIFFIKDDILLTPALDLGILSGVMRDEIIDIAKSSDIKCKETYISIDDLDMMSEAFISSTGIGLLPCYWNDKKFNYELTFKIKKELFKRINNTNL